MFMRQSLPPPAAGTAHRSCPHKSTAPSIPWVELLDSAYIELAFRTAAEADPKAILTYNDFGVEGDAPDNEVKRRAILKMLEGLKKKDVPIGAFGIQSHIGAQWHGRSVVWGFAGLHQD